MTNNINNNINNNITKNINNEECSLFYNSLYKAIKSKDLSSINTIIYDYNHDKNNNQNYVNKFIGFSETQICSLLDLTCRYGFLSALIFLDENNIDITRQRFYYLKSAAKFDNFSIVSYYLNNHSESIKIAYKNIKRKSSENMTNFIDSWSSSKNLSNKLDVELNHNELKITKKIKM